MSPLLRPELPSSKASIRNRLGIRQRQLTRPPNNNYRPKQCRGALPGRRRHFNYSPPFIRSNRQRLLRLYTGDYAKQRRRPGLRAAARERTEPVRTKDATTALVDDGNVTVRLVGSGAVEERQVPRFKIELTPLYQTAIKKIQLKKRIKQDLSSLCRVTPVATNMTLSKRFTLFSST